jgi:mono/diheme cytochrome c family protein
MVLKNYLFTIAIVTGFALWGCGEADYTGADGKPDGSKIYSVNCVSCHGDAGDAGAGGAANLITSSLSKDDVIDRVTNGKGAMLSFSGVLSEEEIEAVATYVMTFRK